MTVYLEGHGEESVDRIYVPENLTLNFFADEGEALLAPVSLAVLSGPEPSTGTRRVCGTMTNNITFARLSDTERAFSEAVRPPARDVRYIGDADNLPNGVMLCARKGSGDCSSARVRRTGRHTCRGVLGVLADETDIVLLTCRSGDEDKDAPVPDHLRAQLAELTVLTERVKALIKEDPAQAYRYLQGLGPPHDWDSDDWANAEKRSDLQAKQELLAAMLNNEPKIEEFTVTYGAVEYLERYGPWALYLHHCDSGKRYWPAWRWDHRLDQSIQATEKYLAWCDAAIRDARSDAEQDELREKIRSDVGPGLPYLIEIDSKYRGRAIATLLTGEHGEVASTANETGSYDWGGVWAHCGEVLAALEAGASYAWAVWDDAGHFLIDSVSTVTAEDPTGSDYRYSDVYRFISESAGNYSDVHCTDSDEQSVTVRVSAEMYAALLAGSGAAIDKLNAVCAKRILVQQAAS